MKNSKSAKIKEVQGMQNCQKKKKRLEKKKAENEECFTLSNSSKGVYSVVLSCSGTVPFFRYSLGKNRLAIYVVERDSEIFP
ncbi:MAG: hypothetical protein PHU28_07130 [Methanosarcinaceae archaeon]|nr:hypothetical protein [Methanosarcinaceae archaeon]